MRLYVAQGRPASALKQYERCVRTLHQELGIEPEAETTELYAEIKRTRAVRGRIVTGPSRVAAAGPTTSDLRGDWSPARQVAAAASPPGGEPGAKLTTALRPSEGPSSPADKARRAISVFGREAELSYLHQHLEKASAGVRQIVFVTGEAGLGKTTLVEAFLDTIGTGAAALSIGQGQCLEHRGPGEAYMPVLEALGRLCRAPIGRPRAGRSAGGPSTKLARPDALAARPSRVRRPSSAGAGASPRSGCSARWSKRWRR